MTSTRFVIELPQHNSDREGTLVDVRDALQRLMHVCSAVFDRVEARIEVESTKLEELDDRIFTIKRKIATIAAQPSKACTLVCISKLPEPLPLAAPSIFSDIPIQKLGEGEPDEFRFRNRRNANEDDDPVVPHDALVELDRKVTNQVAGRVREVLEQTRDGSDDQTQNLLHWVWTSLDTSSAYDEANEDGAMGPPPQSLMNPKQRGGVQEDSPAQEPQHPGRDVGYKPSSKEAHQLGLPTNLEGFLPDIAEHTRLFRGGGKTSGSKQTTAQSPPTTTTTTSVSISADISKISTSVAGQTSSTEPVALTNLHKKSPASEDATTAQRSAPAATASTAPVVAPPDTGRIDLMAAIREGRALQAAKAASGGGPSSAKNASSADGTSPAKTKRPVSLADEMREKLARRQKALSGERDEEEQQAERRRKGRQQETWDDERSSDSGNSLPSQALKTAASSSAATKRPREPATPSGRSGSMPFAGLDALLNRELAAKGPMVPKPPPKPASSVGDWDD